MEQLLETRFLIDEDIYADYYEDDPLATRFPIISDVIELKKFLIKNFALLRHTVAPKLKVRYI